MNCPTCQARSIHVPNSTLYKYDCQCYPNDVFFTTNKFDGKCPMCKTPMTPHNEKRTGYEDTQEYNITCQCWELRKMRVKE